MAPQDGTLKALPVQPDPAQETGPSPWRAWPDAVVLALSSLAAILALAIPPYDLLGKINLVGFAICHQIPERSFVLGGHQLPLCARCTGTFLGAVLGLAAIPQIRSYQQVPLPPGTSRRLS